MIQRIQRLHAARVRRLFAIVPPAAGTPAPAPPPIGTPRVKLRPTPITVAQAREALARPG